MITRNMSNIFGCHGNIYDCLQPCVSCNLIHVLIVSKHLGFLQISFVTLHTFCYASFTFMSLCNDHL